MNVAKSLIRNGLEAHVQDDCVTVRLPVEEFLNLEDVPEKKPKLVGYTTARLTYHSNELLANIHLEYKTEVLTSPDTLPDTSNLILALQECGFVCDSERQIALMYCPGNERVASLFDRLDELDLVKEEHLTNQRYEEAASILHEQRAIRKQIEDIVRNNIQ